MKISLCQLNYHVGNLNYNTEKIISNIEKARSKGIDLVVFSELCVCGYPPKDLLDYPSFIKQSVDAVNTIAESSKNIAVIIGAPSINTSNSGKGLFNSAFFINDGKVTAVTHKGLIPTYDVFDEYRYFEPSHFFDIIEFKNRRIALTICEDIWNIEGNRLYKTSPLEELSRKNPDFIINIAASPFSHSHNETRIDVLSENNLRFHLPIFYVNQVGAQTDLVFDGCSMVMGEEGKIIYTLKSFEEDIADFQLEISKDDVRAYYIRPLQEAPTNTTAESAPEKNYKALVLGIKDYFGKSGFSKALLGLSGGIDSALVAALAVAALGKENVFAVLLPSKYSSDHSITDAISLAENLGIEYQTISIEESFRQFEQSLKPSFKGLPAGVAEENLQARTRGVMLMALSNKLGYVLLNTTNKSEMAVGYGTLYGDMCGAISVLGDLYKTEVYDLCTYINQKYDGLIPENILTKEPSAELRPNQKDSDSLPAYNILDKILFDYIELRKGSQEIIESGMDKEIVKKVLNLVNKNEYKRFQAAPVIRVSDKAFGTGRRIPLEGKFNM